LLFRQKETGLTAAVIVAYISDPDFNGFLKYDKSEEGDIIEGNGVEVFATGLRNAFGLVLHSNGYLYATDSGPNYGYGDMMTGCGPNDFIPDEQTSDELCLVEQGRYYGHPNAHRGKTDPRQCKWRSNLEVSDAEYTSSLANIPSAMGGVMEFQSSHFDGQLRRNLIMCKYTDGLYRAVLTPDGRGVLPESNPILTLQGDSGLDVTQAPNGVLIQTRLPTEDLVVFSPIEIDDGKLVVKSVFPRRGGEAGGNKLDIYGVNFDLGSTNSSLSVQLGESICPISTIRATKIVCIVPGGVKGTVNLTVTNGNQTSSFDRAYRYITGRPQGKINTTRSRMS
jgi:IPT/TIG domain/Glucose / Sorbosone dehydrogenase